MVKLLLSYGADPSLADSQGMTPLAAAVQNNHPDIAVLLPGASPLLDPESLLDAARNGDYKRVRSFLANGYRVNVADAHGFTALFEAAQGGTPTWSSSFSSPWTPALRAKESVRFWVRVPGPW